MILPLKRALLALALAGGAGRACAAPEPVAVALAGCAVVLPADANSIDEYAARELQRHLQWVGGRPVPVRAAARAGEFPFFVGVKPADDLRPFAPEEARWRIGPAGVWLYGRDRVEAGRSGGSAEDIALAQKNEAGTLFAVYEFLEERVGVRWVEPGDAGVVYRHQAALELAPGDGAWAPQMIQRHMRTAYKPDFREEAIGKGQVPSDMVFSPAEFARRQHDELVWQRRMRMGSTVDFTYGHAFRKWWDKYGESHPEYFALGKNGRRGPASESQADRVKMCVSNAALVRQVVSDHFAAHLGLVVNCCENDSRNFCRCADCEALDVLLPGEEHLDVEDRVLTDRYVHFTNAVLAEARTRDPRARTVFYAYSRYNLPPRRERLSDGVILFLLPNLAMTRADLNTYYQAWHEANAKETFLRPNDLCQDTGLPLGFEEHMFEKFKLADQHLQLRGTDYDTCWGFWPVSGITNYIMARAFYRPERSFGDWEEEYCGTYGAASGEVRDYYRYWRQVWNHRVMDHRDEIERLTPGMKLLRNKMAHLAGLIYSDRDFDATDALLQRALGRDLNDRERARVRTLVLANEHNRLTFHATRANAVGSAATAAERGQATAALYAFRRAHRLDLNMNWEQLFYLENTYDDNAGFERMLGTEPAKLRRLRLADEAAVAGARTHAPIPFF